MIAITVHKVQLPDVPDEQNHLERRPEKQFRIKQALSKNTGQVTGQTIRLSLSVTG